MLQLTFLPLLATDTQRLTLLDTTPPYDAVLAPGGYGGPNPVAGSLVFVAILGQQQAGSLRYATTIYAQVGSPLEFELPGDGLYSCLVLAAERVGLPVPVRPIGSLLATGEEAFQLVALDGTLGAFELTSYDYAQLRDLQPPLRPAGEWQESKLVVSHAQARINQVLLDYVRTASRNAPQNGQDYAQHWLQAQATLESITVLHDDGRLPEASQQLAALGSLLYQPFEQTPLLRPRQTDWVEQQTNPTR